MDILRILLKGIIGIAVAVFVLFIVVPLVVVMYVHAHCSHVRSNIAASDLVALNDWAINVYERSVTPDKSMSRVDPNEYCEIIKAAGPQDIIIEKDNDQYVIHIYLSGAFIPSSVVVKYDKTKTKEQCVRTGRW